MRGAHSGPAETPSGMLQRSDEYSQQHDDVPHIRQTIMATFAALSRASALELAVVPIRVLGDLLVRMAETSPRGRALDRLNRTSDAELAAGGTTRANKARRMLGARGAL